MSKTTDWQLRIFPAVFCIFVVVMLYKAEHWFFPPISSFAITNMTQSHDSIIIQGTLVKEPNRFGSGPCAFTGVTVQSDRGTTLDVEFLDNKVHTATRPIGQQSWGPWKIYTPEKSYPIDQIIIKQIHDCHPLWYTRQNLVNLILSSHHGIPW